LQSLFAIFYAPQCINSKLQPQRSLYLRTSTSLVLWPFPLSKTQFSWCFSKKSAQKGRFGLFC